MIMLIMTMNKRGSYDAVYSNEVRDRNDDVIIVHRYDKIKRCFPLSVMCMLVLSHLWLCLVP